MPKKPPLDLLQAKRTTRLPARASPVPVPCAPVSPEALEAQALQLRVEGCTYYAIAAALGCSITQAKAMVQKAAALAMDEDPRVALATHQLRIEGLIECWYSLATGPQPDPKAAAIVRDALALRERLGVWMAHLPSKRGGANDEDFYAEAKLILMEEVDGDATHWHPALPAPMPVLEEDARGRDEGPAEVSDTV